MRTQHSGLWRERATRSSSSPARRRTPAFFGRPASLSCTPDPTLSSKESLTPSMWVVHKFLLGWHFLFRRSWEVWSVTTAPRHQAGEREAFWAATDWTWRSSSTAAARPALARMEAAGCKKFFPTIVLCMIQDEIVHCGLVMGRIKGKVRNWPFRIKGIVQ